MRILGIDPGLVRTGYGLIEAEGPERMKIVEAGVIRTDDSSGISKRLTCIFTNLQDIIKEHRPGVLVLEKIFSHYKHPATAILMGHARGVVCLAGGVAGIKLVNYPSTKIKKSVTGNGQATKFQVQRSVTALLRLKRPPEPVDISDALAIAISYVFMEMRKRTL
ncbi:MAG: crossover junction endodeoxyribonuclease RuvC [Candidatus Omnitrophica bacterium]|nr:crossover junction endodeoxyribonuclease RuvC [Candidatus Omnitrophota bacterium]